HVIRFDRHGGADLPLHADRGLPGARKVPGELVWTHEFLDGQAKAAGYVSDVAEPLLRLFERRQWLTVEWVRRKIRPAIIGDLNHPEPVDLSHPESLDRQRPRKVQPCPA